MTTTNQPITLDQVLALVEQLSIADQAQLVAALALRIAQALAAAPEPLPPSSAHALLAALPQIGTWEGDDLEARLADVYATRTPITFPAGRKNA